MRLPGNASRHAGDTTSIVFRIVRLQRNHVIVGFAILPYRTMLDGFEETDESSPPLGYDTATIPMSPNELLSTFGVYNPQLPATCSVPFAMSQTNTLQWPYLYPYGPVYGQMPSPVVPQQSYAPPSPFTLCKISGNISVCAGCWNKYPKKSDPPDDMCIRHQEWREYTPPNSGVPQGRYANVYYHFNPHCVWLRCRWFAPSCLEIPPEIMAILGPRHKEQLRSLFHIDAALC